MIKRFAKTITGYKPLTTIATNSIADVWHGLKYPVSKVYIGGLVGFSKSAKVEEGGGG